ncbi:MAG TPA: hypothetical protein VF163_13455 [Micromonosporaceae bacterium]
MTSSPRRSALPTLRLTVLAVTTALVLLLGALWLAGFRLAGVDTVWILLPVILGAADLVLLPAVGTTVRPLPYGVDADAATRISVRVLRTITYLRLGLAAAPALFGLVASAISDSLLPTVIGTAFAVPYLLGLTYPRPALVDGVRHRLESGGVVSHLG